MTDKIYEKDFYIKKTKCKVLEVRDLGGRIGIITDRTIFFPTGGGQPCDTGTIGDVRIIDTFDGENGQVIHAAAEDQRQAAEALIGAGDVEMAIDWDRRFENMQRHLGEHMLSGAFHHLFRGTNKGFHMGEEYITIDILTPDGSILDDEQVAAAEEMTNKAIQADLPVTVSYYENAEAASKMPTRKPINIEGRVSVVTVGDLKDPYDCCACCGTHPSTSGQVGLVKVYKHEVNKGMTRIFFDCGMKAFKKCCSDQDVLSEVTDRLSCGTSDLLHRLETMNQQDEIMRSRLTSLTNGLRSREAGRITEEIKAGGITGVYEYETEDLEPNDALKLGFDIRNALKDEELSDGLLLIISAATSPGTGEASRTALLVSDGSVDCGSLVKKYAKAHSGKGGGRSDNARAIFPDHRSLREFIDEIKAELEA